MLTFQCSMYDQYAYYHYETVEEKPVVKPPVLVSFSDERAAKQRREEKGPHDCNILKWHQFNHFQGCLRFSLRVSTERAPDHLRTLNPFQIGPSDLLVGK